ncbi:MAG: ArsA family ATPase [Acidimicrobiales bacterium]
MVELLERDLLFVTGKGGVGKTTIAAALALLAANQGKRTLLCDTDARGDLAGSFEGGEVGFAPRQLQPNLWAMAMDTEASLREYLRLFLRLPAIARLGPLARTFDFVATAAPGVREILVVGKVCYEVRERHWDLVVVDAPASGQVASQLAAPEAINELVKVGLVRQQTGWMMDILSDPARAGVVAVSTPEEMPVNETIELVARLASETRVDLAAVVVNRVLPELFGRAEEEAFEALCRPGPVRAMSDALGGDVAPVMEAARLAVRLRRGRAEHLARLRAAVTGEVPLLYLPYLFARGSGLRATRRLSAALAAELGW